MKRLLLALILVVPGMARADDFFGTEKAASVLNSPSVSVDIGKAAANVVQPAIEQLYDLGGEWRTGASVALYSFRKEDVVLAAIRTGWIVDYAPYVSVPVDLKGVTGKYIFPVLPGKAKSWLGAGPLDLAWSAIGKYGVLGPWIGYNFDDEEDGNDSDGGIVGGVSIGAKLTF